MIQEEKKEIAANILREGTEEWHIREKNIMYQALRERFGPGVDEVLEKAVGERSRAMWQNVAQATQTNSLEDFITYMFDPLPALGWAYTRQDENGRACFRVTQCPKVDLAKKLGVQDLMFLLACATDSYCASGFNENLRFSRTKTLMEGHDCCDHTFWMDNTSKEEQKNTINGGEK